MPRDNDLIEQTLNALERLMRMFAIERILYLLCALVSFALLVFSLYIMFDSQEISWPQMTAIFGASGLIAASAARVSYFLNKSFNLISTIIQRLASLEGK